MKASRVIDLLIQAFSLRPFFLVLCWVFWHPLKGQAICVDSMSAQLLISPQGQAVLPVPKYMPLKLMGRAKQWFKVQDVDGEQLWIHKDNVTTKFKCVMINTDHVNLRKGPSLNAPVYRKKQGQTYQTFKYLQTKGPWVQIEDILKERYWVHKDYVWIQ